MKSKCCHRIRIEELIADGDVSDESKPCYSCYGYKTTCPDYTTLNHLLTFYELFKKDKKIK